MPSIQLVKQSDRIEVHLPDGRTLSGPRGASAGEFLAAIQQELPAPIVGVVVNGELHELTFPISMESRVQPVS